MNMSSEVDKRPLCKYGSSCYQKNPNHHKKFRHPEKRDRSPDLVDANKLKKQKTDNNQKRETNRDDVVKESNENNASNLSNQHISDELLSSVIDDIETKETLINNRSLETLDDRKQFIKEKFLFEMPEDFYQFWDLCKEISAAKPKEAFKIIDLELVGPYDILDSSFKIGYEDDEDYLLHWRYYYDPPEFQTVIKGNDGTGYHMGYFRDSPDESPVFVASNEANKNCLIDSMGENIFAAINTYIEKTLKTADPFKKMSINKLHKQLVTRAKELNINVNRSTSKTQARNRKVVCKTFHEAGIVVPYERKTELGYRPLSVSEKELRKILSQVTTAFQVDKKEAFGSLQPVITAATIANDECDFGTSLELGLDLFCYGEDCLNDKVVNLLEVSYSLLNRDDFISIIKAHMKRRKKGTPYILQSKGR